MSVDHSAIQLAPSIPVNLVGLAQLRKRAQEEFTRQSNVPICGSDIGIIVNFIRHKLTPYDRLMDATRAHKNGFHEREVFRRATLMAIAKRYSHVPAIVQEANRQIDKNDCFSRQTRTRTWRADDA